MGRIKDSVRIKGLFRVEKFAAGADPLKDLPDETIECENMGLTTGLTEMLKLFTGAGGTAFNNTNAEVGVGDNNTAPAASQTDLQASTNKTYVGMAGGYPTAPSSASVQFQASFGSSSANYAWNEIVVKNSSSGVCLNRTTNGGSGWGTKAGGTTWVVTVTWSLS
ncbi:MAG: hypothetical protein M0018_00855 [Nitrospiraceae bacterium]|nr:hypothetical protein [Nitrospiraceae bacterium]